MKRLWILLAAGIFLVTGSFVARAGEIDLLLQKLVEKGVLSAGEAQTIATETKEELKKQNAQGKNESIPQWIQNIKLKGDFRVRYQYDHAKKLVSSKTQTNDESRGRIRMRLGVESKINDKINVGIGLATGYNSDVTNKDGSRSPNQTMTDGFTKKAIGLDYAYLQYTPAPWAAIILGRMKNPLWEPGDLIWDTDISPEGGVVKLNKKIGKSTELFATTGVFILDEGTTGFGADPTMFMMQDGVTQQFGEKVAFKAAVSYYETMNVKGKKMDGTVSTNTNVGGNLPHEFQNVAPTVELSVKDMLKPINVDLPYFALFGEYVKNMNHLVKVRNSGFMFGTRFGDEKVEAWRNWQVRLNYAMLGKDAILDILPDSDRYGGKTGIRAYEAMLDFGLGKNTWLGLDYYYGYQIKGNFGATQSKPASVMQVDWNVKF